MNNYKNLTKITCSELANSMLYYVQLLYVNTVVPGIDE